MEGCDGRLSVELACILLYLPLYFKLLHCDFNKTTVFTVHIMCNIYVLYVILVYTETEH